jgi:hypothetical protein
MPNFHVVSRSKSPVFSNGALGFAVSLISCTGKWIQLFTESVLEIGMYFQHGHNLEENQI